MPSPISDTAVESAPPAAARHAPLELLSPAGNWECARAAVANGADAIYFGMPRFNARLRADNFSTEDLPELMKFLHQHGVRGFVAMNTLIFTSELEDAEEQLRLLEAAGVDAIIVQDLGLVRLAKAVAPELEIHASTQMTITSPEGLEFVQRRLGLDRAVLARELSLREIGKFHATEPGAVPLEVFVHGALCVAYSGQCLTSEALGQRSANRGECAQACRMPYELVVDGVTQDLGDRRYLLSPQDLAAHEEIPELIRLGVSSFKIEGRLKTPEYVAAVTRVYRKQIDAALAAAGAPLPPVDRADRYALEMTFSRGLYSGWMHGVQHQELVHARYGKKRGTCLGTVVEAEPGYVELRGTAPVQAGDGVVFENPADTNNETGGRILEIQGRRLYFDRRSSVDWSKVKKGMRVFKTGDQQLAAELRRTFSTVGKTPGRQPLCLRASGAAGQPLRLEDTVRGVSVASATLLEPARTRPLTAEVLREQLCRLGGTPFHLESLECTIAGEVMLPLSELNQLRRDLVAASAVVAFKNERPASERPQVDARTVTDAPPSLSVLVRTMPQLEAALELGCGLIYADFEDIRRYKDVVAAVRTAGTGAKIVLATPRIQKAGEEGFFKLIERAEPDGVLIRNLGAIDYFAGRKDFLRVGDFSLNAANPLTADFLIDQGLDWLTVSYDLNIQQVLDLLEAAPPEWFELTLHQHIPMFHMEHCVFAAFMSKGKDYTDCGRPCEKHSVELRDRVGLLHPLAPDVGCRNTLYHGKAQTGARFFRDLRATGLSRFRIELLREDATAARDAILSYQHLLAGRAEGATLWQSLNATSRLGVTDGTLEER